MPAPRFQFSLAELLAVALACGALATVASIQLAPFEIRGADPWLLFPAIFIFAVGCALLAFAPLKLRRVGGAVLFILVAMGVVHKKNEMYQQRHFLERNAYTEIQSICKAQDKYVRFDYDGDGVREYAQSLNELYETSAGQKDIGLIWMVTALADGGRPGAQPFRGYLFRVLKRKGLHAAGGAGSFVSEGGHMTKGYAVVAYPATWNDYCRNTFIVSNAGTIYQRDLGPTTTEQINKMTEFDPSPEWFIAH